MSMPISEEEQTACLQCDLLMPRPAVAPGERASCPRCCAHLSALPRDGLIRSFAYCSSAVVLLGLALSFPFLSMKVGAMENVMTLPQSALELYHQGMVLLSFLVAASILILGDVGEGDAVRIPAAIVAGVGFLGAGAIMRSGYSVTGMATAAGIWVTASIGLLVGACFLVISIAATVFVLLVSNGTRIVLQRMAERDGSN